MLPLKLSYAHLNGMAQLLCGTCHPGDLKTDDIGLACHPTLTKLTCVNEAGCVSLRLAGSINSGN